MHMNAVTVLALMPGAPFTGISPEIYHIRCDWHRRRRSPAVAQRQLINTFSALCKTTVDCRHIAYRIFSMWKNIRRHLPFHRTLFKRLNIDYCTNIGTGQMKHRHVDDV